MSLTFKNLSHRYKDTLVLDSLDLKVCEGEILCLLGPSGSGKSTLLRIAAGLVPLQSGEIYLNHALLAAPGREPPPEQRPIGMVFQDHALFPHRTVAENIAFGLPPGNDALVSKLLDQVGLEGFEQRYPHTLSGGQQQRVALARALAPAPRVMMLDEPFASIDTGLREQLQSLTRALLKASNTTSIIVTHDANEALALADEIAVLEHGKVRQSGSADQLWQHPKTRAIAQMFGRTQVFSSQVENGYASSPFGRVHSDLDDGTECEVVVREEALQCQKSSLEQANAQIVERRFMGEFYVIEVESDDGRRLVITTKDNDLAVGDRVLTGFADTGAFVYIKNDSH
ncbi:MAG: ABC transporter ATP-binding protein [Pseudomonadota bacterium]